MSSLPPDPYKILGVSQNAQVPEIRSAHRKLVLKCHPDKVQDPELKAQKQDEFQKVQQAYELLSNDKERQKYDDKVKVEELRKQFNNKANISSPRTNTKYADYEIRTAEPRPNSFKTTTTSVPGGKVYASYSRSYDDDHHGARVEIRTSGSRREQSYSDKPSKRESERSHRERDRDLRDREKEKERDMRRRREREEEDRRENERVQKEIRRQEKKRLEKLAAKTKSRETSDKSRHKSPYIEENDEYVVPRSDKKKSSSKKYEEKVERPSQREDPVMPPPDRETYNLFNAASYIERAGGAPSLQRAATTYHVRNMAPPAPTPPPAQGQSAFATPDDDEAIHRSSANAKVRRGSSDTVKSARSHKKSREFAEEPIIMDASPQAARGSPKVRPTAQFQHAATTTPMMASSPPRSGLGRTNTMPVDGGYTRPAPGMARASTFSSYGESQAGPRGRSRSRMQPQQIDEEEDTDSDYEYERRREHKHRGKKTRSPAEMPRTSENVSRYQVNEGRATKMASSYVRPLESDHYYYAEPAQHSRPGVARDVSYVSGGAPLPKVKMSKAYSYQDVQYSDHGYNSQPYHRDEYAY